MPYRGPVQRWDVFWADLEPAVGTELKKTRPVIVVSNDRYNRHFQDVTAIPTTKLEGKSRSVYDFEVILPRGTISEEYTSIVQPFQIRVLSKTRLLEKIGRISDPDHQQTIEDELLRHLGIEFEEDEPPEAAY